MEFIANKKFDQILLLLGIKSYGPVIKNGLEICLTFKQHYHSKAQKAIHPQ